MNELFSTAHIYRKIRCEGCEGSGLKIVKAISGKDFFRTCRECNGSGVITVR